MKPIFRLDHHKDGRAVEYAMLCSTVEEAMCFERFLYDNNRHWCTGENYSCDAAATQKIKEHCRETGSGVLYYFNTGQWDMTLPSQFDEVRVLYFDNYTWELPFESIDKREAYPNTEQLFELLIK